MKIDILTLFPEMFKGPFEESIVKRAQDKSLVEINIHDLRKWGLDDRRTVDDRPYGGGVGMLMRVDVVDSALQSLKGKSKSEKVKTILLDAAGGTYNQEKARQLAKIEHLILIAGHYEGVDHRANEHLVDEVISIGDYVLTGRQIPAMVIVDSVVRLIPGAVGKEESIKDESHSAPGYLEYPQYTRPEEYKGWKVPKVLLSGNHKDIKKWRKESSTSRDPD